MVRTTSLLVGIAGLSLSTGSGASSLTTVTELDVTKYQGRWYQMYADLFVTSTFERNGVCVTADYDLEDSCTLSDGTTQSNCIGITNLQRDKDVVSGTPSNVTGKAYLPDVTEPGKLNVKFDAPVPSFVDATYWVIALGELTSDGLYSYSVVSDSAGQSLFVLARDVDTFKAQYDDEVQAILKDNGFSGFVYGPRETTQDGCSYIAPGTAIGMASPSVEDDCVKEYKIEDGECGEVCLSSYIAGFAEQFGGVTKGDCASQGYTVFDHTESVSVGPFGDFDTDIYTKPATEAEAEAEAKFVAASSYCPSSGSLLHAGCDLTLEFDDTCEDVSAEIEARVAGQYEAWHDPHNNGTYVLGSAADDLLALKRTTGDGKYTDKMNFALAASSTGGCSVSACSESQVTSVIDGGTNHCNLMMLVCNSAAGCAPLVHDLTYTESVNSCSDSTSECVLV
eukprot:CAMPEP_0182559172 /NCGR_PEP_ID=MMETSP1324-20130603/2394_1 /TAXON_ID=236786 /ORGANISM="Florenciella sp., Strain RCC1587" /LENGTH=450 /DNA_ID=CAMNT_0024771405 /DNA_START=114 /DNA_END=1466 /DNA_ORIENTATION=+